MTAIAEMPAATTPRRVAASSAHTYDGFYFRNHLQCDGSVPSAGPYNVSPDIIGSDAQIPDAQSKLSTPASWNTAYATDPRYGSRNYLYLRGLNGAQDAVADVPLQLYAAPAQLILFPSTWKNRPLHTGSGHESTPVSAQPGAIGVGAEPFVWTPQPPEGASDFYALVSQATPTVPAVRTWTDMGALLTQNLGIGFRNALHFDAGEPGWIHRVGLNIPSTFAKPGQVLLTVSAKGMTGATVGVLADAFTADQKLVAILPAQVSQDSFLTGIQTTLAPGYSASLAIQYWSNGQQPASGSTITLSARYVVPPAELLETSSRGLVHAAYDRFLAASLGIDPQATILLGSVTFIVA